MATAQPDAPSYARPPVVAPGHTATTVTDEIARVVQQKTPKWWWAGFAFALGLFGIFQMAVAHLVTTGIGVWGNNVPVGWGWDIISFVWWIGIGHAGTLISAVLFLFRQQWRTSINRFAEAMTLFAVACALQYPLLHLGRPWLFYWLFPIPNTMGVWPQFRSPLVWDVFAVSTYGLTSLLFWYVGLIPDLATFRDRARSKTVGRIYGLFALGWRGTARHWSNYESAYLLLAGIATPLVVSVHSVVSFDFAVGVVPGWHTTIFPPYFVAGAIYSGFAMVLTLCIPLRKLYKLEGLITTRHLQNMAKVMLLVGLFVTYGYGMEIFMAWYSGSPTEWFMVQNRIHGPYKYHYLGLILCNVVIPQILWSQKARRSPSILFVLSIIINIGMWLERFTIIVISLHRDFMPSAWGMYSGTRWDLAVFAGTIGLFLTLMFLFIRAVPMISIAEMKLLLPDAKVKGHHK